MRNFKDITDNEIKYFCNDVFYVLKWGDIKRTESEISVELYMMEDYPDISDKVTFTIDSVDTHDFDTTEETYLWKQFLYTRGISPLSENNRYIGVNIYMENFFDKEDADYER